MSVAEASIVARSAGAGPAPPRGRRAVTAVVVVVVGALVSIASPTGAAAPLPVDLGAAASFAVVAPTVTNVGPSTLAGDLGVPTAGSLTGFPPGEVVPPATTDLAADDALVAVADAIADAAARPADDTIPAALADTTIGPGVHAGPAATAMSVTGSIVLDGEGDPGAVFIIQVGAALTTTAGSTVSLVRGAQACNVFWVVAAAATLGASSSFAGSLLSQTSITMGADVTMTGRALARDGVVTLDDDVITTPTCDPVDHRPTLDPVDVGTTAGGPVVVTTVGADPDDDPLTYAIGDGPAHGSVTSETDTTWLYTPDAGFVGIDTFTVVAIDPDGLRSLPATVRVHVGVRSLVGTVTAAPSGLAQAGIVVYLIDPAAAPGGAPFVASVVTDAAGRYDMGAAFPEVGGEVPLGTYAIRWVDPTGGHISEYYLDAPDRASSTATVLDAGGTAVVRDAVLAASARIAGTVRSAAPGGGVIEGIQVRLTKVGQAGSTAQETGPDGAYEFGLLRAGDYQVWFRDVNSGRFVSEWHDESMTQAGSTIVTLVAGQVLTLDEALAPVAPAPPPPSAVIEGTVTSTAGSQLPVAGVQVRLYRDGSTGSASTTTDADGSYVFTGRTAGSYRLWFRDVSSGRWISEYYADQTSLAAATVVTVPAAGTVVVDGQLVPRR